MVKTSGTAGTGGLRKRLAWALAVTAVCGGASATTFTVTNTGDSGPGSLREAITLANGASGPHTIAFTASGTISVLSALPALTEQTTIGPAAVGTVILSGSSAGSGVDGLTLSAGGCVVSNLVINGFGGSGIRVTSNGNTINGNRIGTNGAGTAAASNGGNGISLENSSGNVIGQPGAGNLLSGNLGAGIALTNSSNNTLDADVIGLDVSATTALSNVANGVLLQGTSNNNQIGVVGSVADTFVAGNGGAGVAILNGTGNRIRARMFSNAGAGIDLDRNGVGPCNGVNFNDPTDADGGANGLLNSPVLVTSSTTGLDGRLRGAPNVLHTIDVYSNTACDSLGFGEGRTYLGSTTATTDGTGTTTFSAGSWAPVAGTSSYSATATDPAGNTSEFSQCMTPGRRAVETLVLFQPDPDNIPFTPPKADLVGTLSSSPGHTSPLAMMIFNPGAPLQGQIADWVAGDWDGDGIETLGAYASGGAFFYTNDVGPTSNWTGVWFGFANKQAVAGRFDGAVDHDCIGVVDGVDNFLGTGDTAFAMYWTCNLTDGGTSTKNGLWIGSPLPNSGFPELASPTTPHQFVAGDYTGSGVDTLAIRRGPYFVWGSLAQNFERPGGNGGIAVSGDWDGDGISSFGMVYQGQFVYINDLAWHSGAWIFQSYGFPLGSGDLYTGDVWRPGGS